MGNNNPVNLKTTVASQTSAKSYLHHALLTFRPSTSDFLAGFTASTQDWMVRSPTTNLGLVAALTLDTWRSRLKSLGATATDPVWRAADAHFSQLLTADVATGARDAIELPDVLYIGRRTRAVNSEQTITFTTNTAGTLRVRVNPAKYIHAAASPAGALADVTITADGVLTIAQLATATAAALNAVTDFAEHYLASATLGVVTIASLVDGYPLIVEIRPSTPGPTVTLAVTTANVAGDYADDLDDIINAAEFGDHLDPPGRLFYWVTDLQGDDTVGAEGLAWAQDQADTSIHNPPRDYRFIAWSTTGSKVMTIDGATVGNFDPTSTDSLAQTAADANAGEGYSRGAVVDHDRWEFVVPMLLGRTIGYLPGQTSFTAKVLYGSTANARATPRDHGDNETLADERLLSWYANVGPRGNFQYGATPDNSFLDRGWLEDYCTYHTTKRLVEWMQQKNIVTFTNDDIAGGKATIAAALAEIPAVTADTIEVTYRTREQVDPADIGERKYMFYSSFADTSGVINKIGTPAEPSPITLSDG